MMHTVTLSVPCFDEQEQGLQKRLENDLIIDLQDKLKPSDFRQKTTACYN